MMPMPTAAEHGLVACRGCGLVRPAPRRHPAQCARCGARLRSRNVNAAGRTLAFLATAAICYVPANLMPVLVYATPGSSEADTILNGIVSLYRSGSWCLALIVLVASVVIPIGKIGVLAWMCALLQWRPAADLRQATRLFGLVESIGRWSMLDVFVDAFVVALIQLGPVMSVLPGPGVAYFAATAIFTMLAARAFDPRLLWDAHARPHAHG
jgi:paraquat-inducible protein A